MIAGSAQRKGQTQPCEKGQGELEMDRIFEGKLSFQLTGLSPEAHG
jgi:hypothetical protein